MPPANPPAPASDAALASAPKFIRATDQWDDVEWRAVAAKASGRMTEAEQYLYSGGPRRHPWGNAAHYGRLPDGDLAIFPTKAAYEEFQRAEGGKQDDTDQSAKSTLSVLGNALAAAAPRNEPIVPTEDEKLQAASPNGSVTR